MPLTIVSDGVDYFIARILARHGLGTLPVVANRLAGAAGRAALEQPRTARGLRRRLGGLQVRRAAVAQTADPGPMVYVGDGRSDFCVSGRADMLFAKGVLAEHATGQGQPYHAFDTFDDVSAALAGLAGQTPKSRRAGVPA